VARDYQIMNHDAARLDLSHPVAQGGPDTMDNPQTLCVDCYRGKKHTQNESRFSQRTERPALRYNGFRTGRLRGGDNAPRAVISVLI
jgi:hypothetical protein